MAAFSLLLGTVGCSSTSPRPAAEAAVEGAGGYEAAAAVAQPVSAASIAFTPESASLDVDPTQPVTVTVTDGRLTDVTVTNAKGRSLAGGLASDGSSWTSTAPLKLAGHYRVLAVAEDAEGRRTQRSGFFATVAPRRILETSISPLDGQYVGVGMPVIIRFTERVKDRAAVEEALSVKSSKPIIGSWSWTADDEVHFRPKEFWPAYTDVKVKVDLKGVNAGRGVWGMENRTVKFSTGSSMVSVIDVDRYTLTVYRNGEVARVIPVSTGKAGFLTRNGTKVILEKHTLKIMDARTIGISPGDPEYYLLEVPYAMRVTWSGEFVHAAPWSVGSQGRDNVSHGCVGMSSANAIWLFNQSTVGDVVQVVGSPRTLEPGNGYTDWNVSWSDWTAGSALQS
ncbi:MAG: L,D-transpeptidase [Sporichthyaceae bacterium]|nr:L,D-transpeptidase [Sporichthyaceae bacterium]